MVFGLYDLRSPKLGYVGLSETQVASGLLELGVKRDLR